MNVLKENSWTSRTRFLAALTGRVPDRVPIFDWINNAALYHDMLGADPGIYDGALAVRLARAIGLDAAWVPAGGFHGLPAERFTWPDATRYVDEWGTGYQIGADSWPLAFPQTYPVRTMADWQAVMARHPDPHAAWRLAYAQAALAEARQATNGVPGADAPGDH
ncbi:MAG TPA: hypothetical protein VGA61_04910, partial [Anaerolineae bacterium]